LICQAVKISLILGFDRGIFPIANYEVAQDIGKDILDAKKEFTKEYHLSQEKLLEANKKQ
jgi:hypothetical protein